MYVRSFFLLFLVFLGICGNCTKALAQEARVVYIYNWAHYIPHELLEKFEKKTGIKVIYDVFESAEALEAKLFSESGYDVVFPPAWPLFERGVPIGLFLPLDYKKLPNAKGFFPDVMKKLRSADPDHRYGVPYLWGTSGLGFDEEKIKERLPHAPTDSWALLFSPDHYKKLSGCRISLLDSPLDVFQAALLYLGYEPRKATKAQWKKAIGVVRKMRDYIAFFDSTQHTQNLLQGNVCLLQGFSTYVGIAKAKGELLKKNPKKIRYSLLKEGTMMFIDLMAIPRDAPHPENAHKFINFVLEPKNIAEISNRIRAANAVKSSWQWVDPELRRDPMIFPTTEMMKKIYPDLTLPLEFQRFISLEWLKLRSGYEGD